MPVFGLVVMLPPDPEIKERVRTALSADPRVELPPGGELRLPLVLETESAHEETEFIESLLRAGALTVDVAFASFEDLIADTEPESSGEEIDVGPAT